MPFIPAPGAEEYIAHLTRMVATAKARAGASPHFGGPMKGFAYNYIISVSGARYPIPEPILEEVRIRVLEKRY